MLVLHFRTDSSVAHDGFLVEYSFVPFHAGALQRRFASSTQYSCIRAWLSCCTYLYEYYARMCAQPAMRRSPRRRASSRR